MYGYFTPKTVTSVQKNIRVNSKSGLKKFYVKNKKMNNIKIKTENNTNSQNLNYYEFIFN